MQFSIFLAILAYAIEHFCTGLTYKPGKAVSTSLYNYTGPSDSPHNEKSSKSNFELVTREEWGARSAKERANLAIPAPYVVIHHSYTPSACYAKEDCGRAMRAMQNSHMDEREWPDIGYNGSTPRSPFTAAVLSRLPDDSRSRPRQSWLAGAAFVNFAVGSDGVAYEGRGWTTLGTHSRHFNAVSIGICLIGDWREKLPPPAQMETTKALIKAGVREGYVKTDYKLVGHRQVRDTECPGDALFHDLKTWDHFFSGPVSVE
ncbi:Peptidoglycan-recognition protein LB [Eumeta japonica]|uniref:Peptidoglycan-recognition protein LB n=1 Tax=Eumeta variegata TaxID=151549 RepID=A0A4C1UKU5_EUMVA|nr:Peptidoglycan-recognition protein LB [Eumeta japonica]